MLRTNSVCSMNQEVTMIKQISLSSSKNPPLLAGSCFSNVRSLCYSLSYMTVNQKAFINQSILLFYLTDTLYFWILLIMDFHYFQAFSMKNHCVKTWLFPWHTSNQTVLGFIRITLGQHWTWPHFVFTCRSPLWNTVLQVLKLNNSSINTVYFPQSLKNG